MMEVIPININDTKISKSDLWSERIQAFRESGLTQKDWCQQNGIPLSTLGYWIHKIQSASSETQDSPNPVFAMLPLEQELPYHAGAVNHPVTILLPENIQIEIGADCPVRLLTALLQVLKNHA